MQTIHIKLDHANYPILIGQDLITTNHILPYLAGKQVCIVTNETVAPLYLAACQQALTDVQVDTVILPDGEDYKTLASWQTILETLLKKHHHRNTTLISLGGGVIGDMTGFAAACYQRGVAFIQIPTTLLAQVDASIGGKTAVNHPLGKNMIGAFHQPNAVLIDLNTLTTLAQDEFACGMAEVIKAAVIADAHFFKSLITQADAIHARDPKTLTSMIQRACEIKAVIVEQDEKESGSRAYLNLGHTFGHALETVLGYGKIKHGQAVAIGMVLATRLAAAAKLIASSAIDDIIQCLSLFDLPTELPRGIASDALLAAMKLDKKNIDANIRLVLPTAIGQVIVTTEYPRQLLLDVLT